MRSAIVSFAAIGVVPAALAAPVIGIDGAYSVGMAAIPHVASANPLWIDAAVVDVGTAVSIGHIDAMAGLSSGILTFRHAQYGIGTGAGAATTRIADTVTNRTSAAQRLVLNATILGGEIGLAAVSRRGDDRFDYVGAPLVDLNLLAALDFVLRVDSVPVHAVAARLETAGGALTVATGGDFLALSGLTLTQDPSQIFFRWASTLLSIPLGVLLPGQSRTFDYVLETRTRSDSLCFWGELGCGLVTVRFDDPRCAGCPLAFALTSGDDGGPRLFTDVPEPRIPLLLGLPVAALLLRRRRALP